MKFPDEHFRQNDEKLLALKDIHRGKRIFIVGNGPSLTVDDLNKLKDEITFASNRITLIFDQTDWRPTYYTLCDGVVARENTEMVRALKMPKIMSDFVRQFCYEDPTAMFLNCPSSKEEQRGILGEDQIYRLPPDPEGGVVVPPPPRGFKAKVQPIEPVTVETAKADISGPMGWNLLRGARAGHSVVNLGLKLAYWMGVREVYVIGMDHNFVVPEKTTGEVIGSNEVLVSEGERNHFHPDYRKTGEEWTMPKLDVMAEEFQYARLVYEADGGTVKNASRFSKLEVWDRVNLDSIL
jgi:hypothetical protein